MKLIFFHRITFKFIQIFLLFNSDSSSLNSFTGFHVHTSNFLVESANFYFHQIIFFTSFGDLYMQTPSFNFESQTLINLKSQNGMQFSSTSNSLVIYSDVLLEIKSNERSDDSIAFGSGSTVAPIFIFSTKNSYLTTRDFSLTSTTSINFNGNSGNFISKENFYLTPTKTATLNLENFFIEKGEIQLNSQNDLNLSSGRLISSAFSKPGQTINFSGSSLTYDSINAITFQGGSIDLISDTSFSSISSTSSTFKSNFDTTLLGTNLISITSTIKLSFSNFNVKSGNVIFNINSLTTLATNLRDINIEANNFLYQSPSLSISSTKQNLFSQSINFLQKTTNALNLNAVNNLNFYGIGSITAGGTKFSSTGLIQFQSLQVEFSLSSSGTLV